MTQDGDHWTIRDAFEAAAAVQRHCATLLPAQIAAAVDLIVAGLASGGTVYAFGNGGSAAQAQHLVAELVGRFRETRRPLRAVALVGDAATLTCVANDFGYEAVFDRQITGLARRGDIAIGFSTSGRSSNVIAGLLAARAKGARAIALVGPGGVAIETSADVLVRIPSPDVARIQECHMTAIHALVEALEAKIP